jgi:hypothetical protein
MIKPTPNPPHETLDPEKLDEAAQRALDYYLKPNHGQPDKKPYKQPDYFIVAPDADPVQPRPGDSPDGRDGGVVAGEDAG